MPLLPTRIIRSPALLAAFAFFAASVSAPAQEFSPAATDVAEAATMSADDAAPTAFVLFEHRGFNSDRQAQAARQVIPPNRAGNAAATSKRPVPKVRGSTARARVILHIRAAEVRHALPAGLLDAVVAAESNYYPYAVSKAGAAGLAQLMPGTASDMGVLDRFDIRANLDGGARYLRAMLDRFGSVALALAAYNAGPRSVERARGIPANSETPGYVVRVIEYWRALRS